MKIDGIIILNKPTGMNSMKAVKKVQYLLNADKAGHLGTLDPLGSGVLPIALGKATKLFEGHLKDRKVYRTVFKFGFLTDTLDSEGEILRQEEIEVSEQQVKSAIKLFVGKQNQMPPKYSAKKIKGKKAYELARANVDFELKPKEIEIFRFDYLEMIEKNTFLFEIECSSGTYIRSCCRDLAEKLNTCATMVAIIRVQSGEYKIEDSIVLDEVCLSNVLTID